MQVGVRQCHFQVLSFCSVIASPLYLVFCLFSCLIYNTVEHPFTATAAVVVSVACKNDSLVSLLQNKSSHGGHCTAFVLKYSIFTFHLTVFFARSAWSEHMGLLYLPAGMLLSLTVLNWFGRNLVFEIYTESFWSSFILVSVGSV